MSEKNTNTDSSPQPDTRAENSSVAGSSTMGLDAIWQLLDAKPESLESDAFIGMDLGGVTLSRLIAEGGMGRVYEGRQEKPSRPVAVKVLRPGFLLPDMLRRFLKETEILGRLRHPWISQVFSAGMCEIAGTKLPYFVMEYIPDALPITEYASQNNLSREHRLELFRQVCEAVAYGHQQGVVHRDLKPRNILVDGHGHLKVIDFGVARGTAAGVPMTALTDAGQLIGTLQYMSPEQFGLDSSNVGSRSDVYALGLLLYELLVGAPPYECVGKPIVEAARIVQESTPLSLSRIDRSVSRAVSAIVDKCLAKDPLQRFADGQELLTAVTQALNGTYAGPSWLGQCVEQSRGVLINRKMILLLGLPAVFAVIKVGAPMRVFPTVPDIAARQTAAPNTASFSYGFRSVFQKNADEYLVESAGMKKWEDKFINPAVSYWGPSGNGAEGRLVYRFRFPGEATRIHVKASSPCWDFTKEPGGVGRGVSALEASRDGKVWIVLRDNLESRQWGKDWSIDESLSRELVNGKGLWLRMRFYTEDAPAPRGYTVAQFGRSSAEATEDVFHVQADCIAGSAGGK